LGIIKVGSLKQTIFEHFVAGLQVEDSHWGNNLGLEGLSLIHIQRETVDKKPLLPKEHISENDFNRIHLELAYFILKTQKQLLFKLLRIHDRANNAFEKNHE